MEERLLERRVISVGAKAVLTKLPAPEVVTLMDEMVAGDINNNNNTAMAAELAMLDREEMLKSVGKLPTERIREMLRIHGI